MAERQRNKLDWRWLILIPFIVIAFVLAFRVNKDAVDDSATKILNSLAIDNSDAKIKWERYQTTDIELTEALTISSSGTYHISGSLENAGITIDAGVSEVRLILDGVSITNNSGPAILCYNAENLVIELLGDNTLSDGENYLSSYNEDIRSVIYSKADLAFGGTGTLNIEAKHQDGIVGKDDVKFNSGTYNISAPSDAILGKDSVYIVSGEYKLESVNHSIKSTNTNDYGKGFILIENGSVDIESSAKGLRAINSILINGGNVNIDSYDDAVHAENYVGIAGGKLTVEAGDDAIHANKEVIIDGGLVDITKSFEGIEAEFVNINEGTLSIVATDDGINAGDSSDDTSVIDPSKPKHDDPAKVDENCKIAFNGGYTYINSAGDGVDSNGHIYINDGKLVIDGPTDDNNGALDSGLGFITSGGTVVAVGFSGMAGDLGQSSNIFSVSIYFPETQPAGTEIEIKNANDDVIISHTSAKEFNHLAVSTTQFVLGETYNIYLNGEKYQDFKITEIVTTVNANDNLHHNSPKI